MKKYIIAIISVIFLLCLSNYVFANDIFKPYLHNPEVPKHPTLNLEGAYQTELWTGSSTFIYPIIVPPGRNSLQPNLFISYNNHLTGQRPSITGSGWMLSQNYIYRDVKNTFSDKSDDKFILVLNGQSNELVYVPNENRFHTKIESYLFVNNFTNGNNTNNQYWIVKDGEGTIYRFGYNNNSELVSNIHPYTTNWYLDLVNDTHENQIYFTYSKNPYQDDIGTIYPQKIEYNNEKSRIIEFIFENNNRPDMWMVYEQGNKIRESRRLKEIQIRVDNLLVRKYIINYTLIDSSSRSLISSITMVGSDDESTLPSTLFEYYNNSKGWEKENNFISPIELDVGCSDPGGRIVDLNRDGLLDITFYRALKSINLKY